jgi:hypothetical protein
VERDILHRACASTVAARLRAQDAESGGGETLGNRIELLRIAAE